MKAKLNLLPYITRFAVIYLILLTLLLAITTFLNINSKTSIVALIIATFFVSTKFVRDQERAPDIREYLRLSLASLGVSIFISLILVVALLVLTDAVKPLVETFSRISPLLIVAILIGAFSLHFIQLYFFYWLGVKIQLRSMNSNKPNQVKNSARETLAHKNDHASQSGNIPSIWKVIISFFIPGFGSLLIRGWKSRGIVFFLLIFTVPVSFFFFGPYWGEVLFAGTKYTGTGGWLFLAVCIIVPLFSLLLAYNDRKKVIMNI